ncbi:MAG: LysE family translocator [Runella slithyformis]|nr:MAG: LysE family translocator [Runella slithyformis]TAF96604.1 MAG: LysE family translocator [Runella sp.]TAG19951.1 MAG: LysE family translocator [Cytophagales bacterium]TAG40094.1 MAG: LysE family translocator [Cytophagia bacterium]TAF78898.1 MAG: LysE family translocator [Runella slithyformis]
MLVAGLYGFFTGVLLCLTFGTVFFALIQTSLQRGYQSGISIAMGVVASDAFFVFCAVFGTSFLPQVTGFNQWMAGAGIVFLLILGVRNLFKMPVLQTQAPLEYKSRRLTRWKYFFKGVALNALNPINFVSWVTIATYLRTTGKYDLNEMLFFFGFSLVGVGLTEAALAIFAHRLRRFLTVRVVRIINVATGLVFMGVATNLIFTQFLK